MHTIIHEPMMFHAFVGLGLLTVQASPIADGDDLWSPVWQYLDLYEHEFKSTAVVQDHRWYYGEYRETVFAIKT